MTVRDVGRTILIEANILVKLQIQTGSMIVHWDAVPQDERQLSITVRRTGFQTISHVVFLAVSFLHTFVE